MILLFSFFKSEGQTIVSDSFENTSTLFTGTGTTYYSGNTGGADGPANSPQATLGTYGIGANNTSAVLTSSLVDISGCTSPQLSFKLASISVTSAGNGADGTDNVRVEVSPDGGTTYYNTIQINGNTNAYWAYSATGVASTPYDGNVTPVTFAPAGGGSRNADGYSTVIVTGLPVVANLRIRITMLNNAANEKWIIDDFVISGSCGAPNTITTGSVNNPPFSLTDCTVTASGDVAFTSSGTFNAGNIYTAQLSNASGSFTSAISIGSISSTANSGTISFTIPAGTASGTGYMIRVMSDNPVIVGSNSAAFTITTTCTPTITPGGTITACAFSGAMSIYDKCNNGQGCTSGCDLTSYSNLGYTMCNGSSFTGNCPTGQQLQGIVFNIPSGCTMNVIVEFKKRAGACTNSGMDGGDYLKINSTTYTGSSNADVIQSITQTGGSIFIEQSADRSEEILTFTASVVSGSCIQCSLLDVTLLSFNCVTESDGYKLLWATANEHQSKNFEIEYSIDGINFLKIDELPAQGESNSYIQYEKYVENVFSSPLIYFRLKMNDLNGGFFYSPVIYVQNDFFSSLSVSPNPSVNSDVVVYVGTKMNYLNSTVSVYDVDGKLLVNELIKDAQTKISTQNFSEGIYLLKISSPYKTQNFKLIIQK